MDPMHLVSFPRPNRKQRVRIHVLVHREVQFVQPKLMRPLDVAMTVLQHRIQRVDPADVGCAIQAVVGLDGDTDLTVHHHRIHATRWNGHETALRFEPPRGRLRGA